MTDRRQGLRRYEDQTVALVRAVQSLERIEARSRRLAMLVGIALGTGLAFLGFTMLLSLGVISLVHLPFID